MPLFIADRVHTFASADAVDTRQRPDALLVRDGRIVAVGTHTSLSARAPRARVMDLRGCTVTPGLTDAHIHPVEWSLARLGMRLDVSRSPAEAAEQVARHAASSSAAWLRGWGWSLNHWTEEPSRALLDRRIADRPVVLTSHDLHAIWVNTAALERAGITAQTQDPDGGRIVREPSGEPTGLLLENATRLILDRVPPPSAAELADALTLGQAELHRLGITGIHTVEPDSLRPLEQLRAADRLRLRVLQHLPLHFLEDAVHLGMRSGFGGEWIRIGGVKIFLDGALGSRTAHMLAPYEGSADRGVELLSRHDFNDAVRLAASAGIASTVHAIGDAAVDAALDVLADPTNRAAALPHRIEHLQLCPLDRLADAAAAGITCSVQPAHLITDWRAAERHWGRERSRGAYAFRSLRNAHSAGASPSDHRSAVLAFGSDAPVEPVDPRLGLYAATTRQDLDGEPHAGWFPEERITVHEALRAYTIGPAIAAGQPERGRLAPGSPCDFAAWDRDPLQAQPDGLLDLRCLATVVAGHIVWSDRGQWQKPPVAATFDQKA